MNTPNCPDCNVPMEEGLIVDATYGGAMASHWQPGKVKTPRFMGIVIADGFAQVDRERWREVVSYCCPKCNLLREYAPKYPTV